MNIFGNTGGLGGLGGVFQNPNGGLNTFGQTVSAVGQSMMSSPSNNMLQNFGTAFQGQQSMAKGAQATQAMVLALKRAGFADEEAKRLAANPQMAEMALKEKGFGASPTQTIAGVR